MSDALEGSRPGQVVRRNCWPLWVMLIQEKVVQRLSFALSSRPKGSKDPDYDCKDSVVFENNFGGGSEELYRDFLLWKVGQLHQALEFSGTFADML